MFLRSSVYVPKIFCLRSLIMSSLATVRDSLVTAYSQNIFDDVEFALLYDANMSKPVFPYSKYERFKRNRKQNNGISWFSSNSIVKLIFGCLVLRYCSELKPSLNENVGSEKLFLY